jgi:hypothetical protein
MQLASRGFNMSSALSARSRPSRANRSCNTPNAERLKEDDGLFQKADFLDQ